ncbi:dihydroneopterin aldolase [Paramicrobacterium chengjingii]|uniref:dihydroneopterin aldolase n=1 Tax=Paramicrobacterium chengjingii TaxID=2769067 RepID=UPI0014234384|nr:dihydroneopterin aldolase [Microbacterium chengjingii]
MNDSDLDAITITGIRVHANHGVFDFERENGQEFIVDVTVFSDLSDAGARDDLSRTVHYGELAEAVAAAVASSPVDLIETVAERVARTALEVAAVQRVRVTLHKPQAPISVPFDDVSVTITRSKERA